MTSACLLFRPMKPEKGNVGKEGQRVIQEQGPVTHGRGLEFYSKQNGSLWVSAQEGDALLYTFIPSQVPGITDCRGPERADI